ncbi:hypothetical protein [Sphingomonas montanisoli]|uniref:Uncharacterized protein n=1 Tax=Sphingomonas montanisoli TaxID=2606412 RepID=A0A5D9CC77_9SPHN|nr:hypothetical protein [Sphingomonas montanisoli]TZG28863.1 hypothetical protein FYJ91_01595 [Sphingomonas montanisoli]
MIDTGALILAHLLLAWAAFRMFNSPDLNTEPQRSKRQFKLIGPKNRPFDQDRSGKRRRA